MKRAALATFYSLLYRPGVLLRDGGISILCYHAVDDSGTAIAVPPRVFAEQMATLAGEGCNTFSMNEVAERLASGRPFPPRAVAITFDDGFESVATAAAPIMARHGFSGTVYVISGMVGRATRWTDHGRPLPSLPLLSWPQIKGLREAGFEVGAHTVSHGFLSRCSPEELRREVGDCRPALEQELGAPVRSFAYPQGDYNRAVVEAVRAAGYSTAVTLDQGRAGRSSDRLRLRRLYAGNNTSRAAIRAFTVPAIGPAYRLINLAMRGLLGRKTWPGPQPGTVQSTETVPIGAAT